MVTKSFIMILLLSENRKSKLIDFPGLSNSQKGIQICKNCLFSVCCYLLRPKKSELILVFNSSLVRSQQNLWYPYCLFVQQNLFWPQTGLTELGKMAKNIFVFRLGIYTITSFYFKFQHHRIFGTPYYLYIIEMFIKMLNFIWWKI